MHNNLTIKNNKPILAYFSTCSHFMKFTTVLYSSFISGVTGTSLQRSARYFDIIGHCRDHPVDSLTDTMSDINYAANTSTNLVTDSAISRSGQ